MNELFSKQAGRAAKRRKALNALAWTAAILALLLVIGAVVCLVMLGLGDQNFYLLGFLALGGMLGAAALGGVGFALFRAFVRAEDEERDLLERADSEESFTVGEGTLATFTEDALVLHGQDREKRERRIRVPYKEMRFFSVLVRHAPREKGEWRVLFEIPSHYLSKKPHKGEPPALIETQGKERLKACIAAHDLVLLGETPAPSDKGKRAAKPEKPQREQRFVLPDAEKRRRQFPFLLLGAGLLVGGIVVAILANRTIGIVLSCFGVYLLIHGAVGYVRARTELVLFREGIWDKKATRAESSYLTWEEIESVSFFGGREGTDKTPEEKPALILTCAYGDHGFTPVKEAYDYLLAHHPEKCRKDA